MAEVGVWLSTTCPPGVEYRCTAPVSVLPVVGGGVVVVAGAVLCAGVVVGAVVLVAGGTSMLVVSDCGGAGSGPLVMVLTGSVTCGNGSAVSCMTVRTPSQDTPTAAAVAHSQATVMVTGRTAHILPDSPGNVVRCSTVANVLVVEDEPAVRTAVIRYLTAASHTVRSVGTALEALREVAQQRPDVVVLDLGLPDLNGAEALKMMRGVCDVPVIVATARDDETEIVRLLNIGADDYLIKPFSGEHLNARLTALLRRTQRSGGEQHQLVVGGLRIDLRRREATLDGVPLDLVRREFDLLAFLAARPGEVVSRRELLAQVWQQPYGEDQTIDVHLSWLRRKLGERAAEPRYLHTVRGVGVKLDAPQRPA